MAHGYKNILGENRINVPLFQTGNATLDAVLTDWFFGTTSGVTYYGILKRYNGSTWVKEPLKTYLGGSFQAKPLKRWSGTAWLLVDTTGI